MAPCSPWHLQINGAFHTINKKYVVVPPSQTNNCVIHAVIALVLLHDLHRWHNVCHRCSPSPGRTAFIVVQSVATLQGATSTTVSCPRVPQFYGPPTMGGKPSSSNKAGTSFESSLTRLASTKASYVSPLSSIRATGQWLAAGDLRQPSFSNCCTRNHHQESDLAWGTRLWSRENHSPHSARSSRRVSARTAHNSKRAKNGSNGTTSSYAGRSRLWGGLPQHPQTHLTSHCPYCGVDLIVSLSTCGVSLKKTFFVVLPLQSRNVAHVRN